MQAIEEPAQIYVLPALISQKSTILHRAHYPTDSYFQQPKGAGVPSIAHVIASIARDDDQVSILENCKEHSAENSTALCPDAAMCGTQIEKKKDVRDG